MRPPRSARHPVSGQLAGHKRGHAQSHEDYHRVNIPGRHESGASPESEHPKKPDSNDAGREGKGQIERPPHTPAELERKRNRDGDENRQALAQTNGGKVVEAMSGAAIKELLPAELPGMKRASASGERTQVMGVDISNAEGRYVATDGQGARVEFQRRMV